MYFVEWKFYISFQFSPKFFFSGDLVDMYIIGYGNGLSPNRRQAITVTNDDRARQRFMATLGNNELSYAWNEARLYRVISYHPQAFWI